MPAACSSRIWRRVEVQRRGDVRLRADQPLDQARQDGAGDLERSRWSTHLTSSTGSSNGSTAWSTSAW